MKYIQIFEEHSKTKWCPECQGDGEKTIYWSCCGDEVEEDAQLCPTCKEHIDGVEGETEKCEKCNGTGKLEE